jgi:isopentenyl-diphosphate delta-isomerase
MGFIAELTEVFTFAYKAEVGDGLKEHEFDHVFFGISNQVPNPNPIEVSNWEWFPLDNLMQDLIVNSERYSFWLPHCFDKVITHKNMIKSPI